mmetsp:Transcript_7614/g.14434  ORF Transcript_7614/g.14434 Transcript_7614/m.14434 type:complete len:90 (-) Transcript_7614:70-339(-)
MPCPAPMDMSALAYSPVPTASSSATVPALSNTMLGHVPPFPPAFTPAVAAFASAICYDLVFLLSLYPHCHHLPLLDTIVVIVALFFAMF